MKQKGTEGSKEREKDGEGRKEGRKRISKLIKGGSK